VGRSLIEFPLITPTTWDTPELTKSMPWHNKSTKYISPYLQACLLLRVHDETFLRSYSFLVLDFPYWNIPDRRSRQIPMCSHRIHRVLALYDEILPCSTLPVDPSHGPYSLRKPPPSAITDAEMGTFMGIRNPHVSAYVIAMESCSRSIPHQDRHHIIGDRHSRQPSICRLS
jgi:hypothetical protein